jgi:hypothetical protein
MVILAVLLLWSGHLNRNYGVINSDSAVDGQLDDVWLSTKEDEPWNDRTRKFEALFTGLIIGFKVDMKRRTWRPELGSSMESLSAAPRFP